MKIAMRSRTAELTNFFWHCAVATKMTHDMAPSTVARSYRLLAVRKATDCWTGRGGIKYASTGAIEHQLALGTPWERSRLVKEHAVPVAVINNFVQEALDAASADPRAVELPVSFTEESQNLPSSVVTLFQQDPMAWLVAKVVMEWTLHA